MLFKKSKKQNDCKRKKSAANLLCLWRQNRHPKLRRRLPTPACPAQCPACVYCNQRTTTTTTTTTTQTAATRQHESHHTPTHTKQRRTQSTRTWWRRWRPSAAADDGQSQAWRPRPDALVVPRRAPTYVPCPGTFPSVAHIYILTALAFVYCERNKISQSHRDAITNRSQCEHRTFSLGILPID